MESNYDLVINNGLIIDGSNNNKAYKSNIGIKDDKIAIITNNNINGILEIDATNKIVCPGFIDIHSHSDYSFLLDSRSESKIYQGVTTEIVGNCGDSIFPITKNHIYSVTTLKDFIKKHQNDPMSINWGTLIGHNSIRISVMGYENRKPTVKEMNTMKNIIKQSIEDGAFGMSLGLIYIPGVFANTNELLELSRTVKECNGVLTAHIRNEGNHLLNALEEMIIIQEQTKVHIHISHIKTMEKEKGNSLKILKYLDDKINNGYQITMDAYPYDCSWTTLSILLPNNVYKEDYLKFNNYYKDHKEEVLNIIKDKIQQRGGPDKILVVNIQSVYPFFEGKSLEYIGNKLKIMPEQVVARIIIESKDKAAGIYQTMNEDDVINFLTYKHTSIITDGSSFSFANNSEEGIRHPRSFGTYPKFIRMVMDHNLLSLEEAVYKTTCLPAKTLSISNKGLVKEQYDADIVIFDINNIKDLSTYSNLFTKPTGIEYVIVNGKIAINNGIQTSIRAGKFILKTK